MTTPNTEIKWPEQRVVVAGAGVSGLAAMRLLHRLGAQVRLLERNPERISEDIRTWASEVGVEICCGQHVPAQFEGASFVVPSPGVAASVLQTFFPKTNPPAIMAETELAWRCLTNEPVLAVTGTSGKTTTTSLCSAMLQEQGLRVFTGGNIGTPLSEYVLSVQDGADKADVLVLELSSFQLQTCSTLRPHVAVLLNISENHLDYHADMEEYVNAKMRLFACQTESDHAVLHHGLEYLIDQYGLKAAVDIYDTSDRFVDMQLFGRHNRANAEAAWRACRIFGVTEEAARRAVASFIPLGHRLERAGERNGVLYVNDSKSTTVEALKVALEAFESPVMLLAGGTFKGGDLVGLRPLLRQRVRAVALFGGSRTEFETGFADTVPVSWDETLEQAMQRAARLACPGDVVLLSPATSSFDQYPNYKKRGEDFCRVVREIL